PRSLYAAELARVVAFVRAGGRVVAAGAGGGITHCVGWRTKNEEAFLLRDSFPVVSPVPALTLPPVADFLKPRRDDVAAESRRRVLGGPIEEHQCDTLSATAEDTLLRLTDGRPAVLRLDYGGGGSVTLFADPGYFRNRLWRSGDVPYFVTPLLVPARRGRVVWDEYHQGFGRGRSMTGVVLGWLVGTPGGWAITQLVGVLVVGLAVAGVRFGPARRDVLVCLLARCHVLLEGVPGTAKTLLVRTLGLALDVKFQRIQFTPDLMPADITGISILTGSHEFTFRPGPIFADLVLADEINRAPAKTQAALLEAMQERTVTVDGVSHPLSATFAVFATQ